MSQNDTITFTCPSCSTELQVPLSLAGVTGPCPQCQTSITAPHPTSAEPTPMPTGSQPSATPQLQEICNDVDPAQAPQIGTSEETAAEPSYKKTSAPPKPRTEEPTSSSENHSVAKRKSWPGVIFPLLFLLLSAAVIYLILDLMGFFKSGENAPSENQNKIPTADANSTVENRGLLPVNPIQLPDRKDNETNTETNTQPETTPTPDLSLIHI